MKVSSGLTFTGIKVGCTDSDRWIMITKNAAIYCRVSTDEQTKGYSLATQIEACRQFAAQKGYRVTAEFSDDYTGAALDRPELNELRELIANDSLEAVIVYDLDRLAPKECLPAAH
jgi:site-specific DNA recombinase